MFNALLPLLKERSIHMLLSSTKDDRIALYIEPAKLDDKEDAAFFTPFRCEGTAAELNAELAAVLSQWVATRSTVTASLKDALAAAEAQAKSAAEEAKKKAAERNLKKPTPAAKHGTSEQAAKVSATKTSVVVPSLFDDEPQAQQTAPETHKSVVTPEPVVSSLPQPALIPEPIPVPVASPTTGSASALAAAESAVVSAVADDPFGSDLF